MNLTQKIIGSHLVSGTMTPGSEIGLRIDQTLTQDATGTMAWLQFEALGIPRVKTDISLSYVDHNTPAISMSVTPPGVISVSGMRISAP